MNPNKRILISEGLKKILELKMFYKNHALAWTIFYDNFPKATDFKWKKRMPQVSEIILVFTVKNTNILYMPGLFNHPSKIKLKRKYKEKNREIQSWKRAPYFDRSTDIMPETFFLPWTKLFE